MIEFIINLLFSVLVLLIGIYQVYDSYTKPAELVSTDFKGYISGTVFIIFSLMSIFGKISLLQIFISIVRAIFTK